MSVGTNIKRRRFELRMSQQELADALGYKTRSTIAKIESGENDVSQRKLQKIAIALDTTVEALISGTDTPHNTPVVYSAQYNPKQEKTVAIILAGGRSSKNQQSIPSQFINVQGKPILVYCMEVYQAHPSVDEIYIVCLKGWENIVNAYAAQFGITKLKGLIPGGSTGILSLKNAVDLLKNNHSENDLVIIQESTRPLVNVETVSTLLQACHEKGSATICRAMREYVQFTVNGDRVNYIDRNTAISLQSPEAHSLSILIDVFNKASNRQHQLTESCCTMLLYNLGYNINFVEGSINNIKIARDEDIATFSAIVSNKFSSVR